MKYVGSDVVDDRTGLRTREDILVLAVLQFQNHVYCVKSWLSSTSSLQLGPWGLGWLNDRWMVDEGRKIAMGCMWPKGGT